MIPVVFQNSIKQKVFEIQSYLDIISKCVDDADIGEAQRAMAIMVGRSIDCLASLSAVSTSLYKDMEGRVKRPE